MCAQEHQGLLELRQPFGFGPAQAGAGAGDRERAEESGLEGRGAESAQVGDLGGGLLGGGGSGGVPRAGADGEELEQGVHLGPRQALCEGAGHRR
ncbi:hypothetical protein [Streptacidiphilus sp. P02-A3a]|uniref:hypothetical protein n=1 Tax=Streptacidiphilus sp. P02-A3a TaxID=2704468 RepID=UPI0015FD7C86|nr:hypothetical protein [Streptacidiphilus sp. P02-A3a]QMU66963.1 hypothetical protein GXP74_00755 [Streptacidiphilus sp. P02-A3a]